MDNNNIFDLSFWAKKESVATLKSNAVNNQVVAATRAALPTEDLFRQVDALVSEVVNRGIDLTQGYVSWRNIGFALAVKLGVMLLGVLGVANMWLAVFADVGVAMLCILNAMRALRA